MSMRPMNWILMPKWSAFFPCGSVRITFPLISCDASYANSPFMGVTLPTRQNGFLRSFQLGGWCIRTTLLLLLLVVLVVLLSLLLLLSSLASRTISILSPPPTSPPKNDYTHTHTHICVYTYICVCIIHKNDGDDEGYKQKSEIFKSHPHTRWLHLLHDTQELPWSIHRSVDSSILCAFHFVHSPCYSSIRLKKQLALVIMYCNAMKAARRSATKMPQSFCDGQVEGGRRVCANRGEVNSKRRSQPAPERPEWEWMQYTVHSALCTVGHSYCMSYYSKWKMKVTKGIRNLLSCTFSETKGPLLLRGVTEVWRFSPVGSPWLQQGPIIIYDIFIPRRHHTENRKIEICASIDFISTWVSSVWFGKHLSPHCIDVDIAVDDDDAKYDAHLDTPRLDGDYFRCLLSRVSSSSPVWDHNHHHYYYYYCYRY